MLCFSGVFSDVTAGFYSIFRMLKNPHEKTLRMKIYL